MRTLLVRDPSTSSPIGVLAGYSAGGVPERPAGLPTARCLRSRRISISAETTFVLAGPTTFQQARVRSSTARSEMPSPAIPMSAPAGARGLRATATACCSSMRSRPGRRAHRPHERPSDHIAAPQPFARRRNAVDMLAGCVGLEAATSSWRRLGRSFALGRSIPSSSPRSQPARCHVPRRTTVAFRRRSKAFPALGRAACRSMFCARRPQRRHHPPCARACSRRCRDLLDRRTVSAATRFPALLLISGEGPHSATTSLRAVEIGRTVASGFCSARRDGDGIWATWRRLRRGC